MVFVMLLVVLAVVVLLQVILSFRFRFWFGVRFGLGSGLRLRRTPSWWCQHTSARCVGGVRRVLTGCLGCLCAGQRASGSLACGCSFGFGRCLVDEVGGEGGIGGGDAGRP